MFGVVLWSDATENKAVIWCEDQGDLAFYRQTGEGGEIALDPGDLVKFEMTMDRHLRFAHNPELVSEAYHPDLVTALSPSPTRPVESADERMSARIIPFRAPDAEPAVVSTNARAYPN